MSHRNGDLFVVMVRYLSLIWQINHTTTPKGYRNLLIYSSARMPRPRAQPARRSNRRRLPGCPTTRTDKLSTLRSPFVRRSSIISTVSVDAGKYRVITEQFTKTESFRETACHGQ